MTTKHYLYGDNEVKCTGRYVNKPNSITKDVEHLVEVTPIEDDINWTKFVNIKELYVIQSLLDNTGEPKRIESP